MKDRAIRRHHDFRVKQKNKKNYNSCIGDHLTPSEKQHLEDNLEKYRRACVLTHQDKQKSSKPGKTLQEKKHDITMKEQLRFK